jgi:CheY-like chemotaxis protein
VLAVADEGAGIPPDLLEQVTEPFFTTKEVGKGTGLGLSMVYGFARQSGGSMDISSEIDRGTVVEIWLPRAPAAAAKRERREAPPAAPRGEAPTRPLRILLVDDHDAVRETTAGMLSDMGHAVEAVCNGPDMLQMLEAAPSGYDLIVTDYAMPLMSGSEMLEHARKIRADLPGIIISGYADSQSMARRPREIAVLTKPFTPDQMKAAIGAVFVEGRA